MNKPMICEDGGRIHLVIPDGTTNRSIRFAMMDMPENAELDSLSNHGMTGSVNCEVMVFRVVEDES